MFYQWLIQLIQLIQLVGDTIDTSPDGKLEDRRCSEMGLDLLFFSSRSPISSSFSSPPPHSSSFSTTPPPLSPPPPLSSSFPVDSFSSSFPPPSYVEGVWRADALRARLVLDSMAKLKSGRLRDSVTKRILTFAEKSETVYPASIVDSCPVSLAQFTQIFFPLLISQGRKLHFRHTSK